MTITFLLSLSLHILSLSPLLGLFVPSPSSQPQHPWLPLPLALLLHFYCPGYRIPHYVQPCVRFSFFFFFFLNGLEIPFFFPFYYMCEVSWMFPTPRLVRYLVRTGLIFIFLLVIVLGCCLGLIYVVGLIYFWWKPHFCPYIFMRFLLWSLSFIFTAFSPYLEKRHLF